MNKLKLFFLKLFSSSIDLLVQHAVDSAVDELRVEVDASIEDPAQREAIKASIELLRTRVPILLRKKLGGA